MNRRNRYASCLTASLLAAPLAFGQADDTRPVLVSGTVADEAAKAALLARVREVFGSERVVDQLAIGKVAAPANWDAQVRKLVDPRLKAIHAGRLSIEGNAVSLQGEVASDALRREIADGTAASLHPGYTVSNTLRVKSALIPIPNDGIVEFETGKALLTEAGRRILDQVSPLIRAQGGKVKVIGHTDDQGGRARNLSLSLARAQAVKAYIAAQGIDPAAIAVAGEGPDRPVDDNATAQGRARNRRIEFRIVD